jgi:hypothetical protein
MNVLQLFSCAIGRHRRDRKLAWHDGDQYASWCTGRGCELRRHYSGWRVEAHVRKPLEGHHRAELAQGDASPE